MGERGDEWELQRIGTEREKMHVEKELQELRERLAQVEKWRARHAEIEKELAKVWVEGGDDLSSPSYVESQVAQSETTVEATETNTEDGTMVDASQIL